jgi:hypothetical protein
MTKRNTRFLLVAAALAAGCERLSPPPKEGRPPARQPPAAEAAEKAWTPERITQDPGGYLTYADAEIVRQISEREMRIGKIEASRQAIDARSEKLRQDLRDAANIQKRLQAAAARADEDDAWPITFAGRKFERAKALSAAEASQRFVQSRTPLANEYEQALAKIDATGQSLRSDISELGRLREKLALDMERVRLNQGIAEVAELRKSVEALSGFATSLADTTDNPLEDLASKSRPLAAEAELETLLGK